MWVFAVRDRARAAVNNWKWIAGPALIVALNMPLVNVSTAQSSVGNLLPSDLIAAANDSMSDARALPAWRQDILSWYSQAGGDQIGDVQSGPANYYHIFDVHGLVWEWVDDFNAFMVTGDNREQGGADQLQFCGAGAITMEEKENYAVLMRVAMLSALEARYTTRNLGFRCAREGKFTQ